MLPRISVVIPSFNQGLFIERTINSILNQNYPELDLILVDGGSQDSTMRIVERYAHSFSRIISEPDEGQAHALRKGFEVASGEIYAWLNSDDCYAPGALSFVGQFFSLNTDVCLMYGDYSKIGPKDEILERKRQPSFHLGIVKYAYLTIPQQAAFWSARAYHAIGGVDPNYKFTMDYDLFVRLAQTGGRIVHVRRELAYFRIHPESKTSTLESTRMEEDQRVRSQYCAVRPRTFSFAMVKAYFVMLLIIRCLWEGCLWEKIWYAIGRTIRRPSRSTA